MTKQEKIKEIERIYSDEFDSLVNCANFILHNKQDAEDAVQDGFINSIKYASSFRDSGNMFAWCNTCVINAAIDIYRKKARSIFKLDLDSFFNLNGAMFDETDEHEFIFSDEVIDALSRLTDIQREVIILRDITGVSQKEAALTIGIHEKTLATRLFNARKNLRKSLKRNRIF